MLCQFTVKNYKSIKDAMTLDMQAAAISEHTDQIIVDNNGEAFLPISAIYGPNGGGKSNILGAMLAVLVKILVPVYSARRGNSQSNKTLVSPQIEPFAFSAETKERATEFEIYFRTSNTEYRYILHIRENSVEYESLDRYKLTTNRPSGLFERKGKESILKGELTKLKISEDVSEQLPLLSYLAIMYGSNEIIKDVFDWFDNQIMFLNYAYAHQEREIEVIQDEKVKALFLMMLKEMDIPITDFRAVEENGQIIEIYTKHHGEQYDEELAIEEESNGTQKLFHLLPYIIRSLTKGTTLIVDELDARLHPLLLKRIIQMYTDLGINRHGAQLIFTSHDLSTMSNELFRRDEIWFVAKGKGEDSKLYSLVEFKNEEGISVRKDAVFEKQYLEGRYGADPYLKKIIDWSVADA